MAVRHGFGAQRILSVQLQRGPEYLHDVPADGIALLPAHTRPPAPFQSVVGTFAGDPDYSCKGGDADGCDESWAVIMRNCQNIHIGAAGTYSWFSTYTQDCIDQHSCQKALWLLDNNYDHNRLQHIIAIGAKNIIVSPGGTAITSNANLAVTGHPAWAHISLYDVPSIGSAPPPEDDPCLDQRTECTAATTSRRAT